MKLAEALVQRKHIKKDIDQLRERLKRVLYVQTGNTPAEDPQELLTELNIKVQQLGEIIVRINKTNIQAKLNDGRALMEAIATRDMLNLQHSVMTDLSGPSSYGDMFSRVGLHVVPTVNIRNIYQRKDEIAKQLRELDAQIQLKNWEVELAER